MLLLPIPRRTCPRIQNGGPPKSAARTLIKMRATRPEHHGARRLLLGTGARRCFAHAQCPLKAPAQESWMFMEAFAVQLKSHQCWREKCNWPCIDWGELHICKRLSSFWNDVPPGATRIEWLSLARYRTSDRIHFQLGTHSYSRKAMQVRCSRTQLKTRGMHAVFVIRVIKTSVIIVCSIKNFWFILFIEQILIKLLDYGNFDKVITSEENIFKIKYLSHLMIFHSFPSSALSQDSINKYCS